MPQPLFSIAIPTFNYGRFLRRAVDSVLMQAADDCELIVVDDGSTDDTPARALAYGDRLQYIRQERRGVYEACKQAFDASSGRFLVFLDADDALRPEALAVLRREIDKQPDVGVVAGRHENVAATGRRESPQIRFSPSRVKNFRDFLLGNQFICTGSAAIRREAVSLIRRYDGKLRTGMETACLAQTLWFYDAVAVDDILLEVHDHPDRLRDNLNEIRLAGEELVEAVFDASILPPEAMAYQRSFRARLLRDRCRSYHKGGHDAEAISVFQQAMRTDPWRSLTDARNLRRYVVSHARLKTAPASSAPPRAIQSCETGVVEVAGAERFRGHRRRFNADTIGFLQSCSGLGKVVKLKLSRPTYLLNDPQDIQHVFIHHPGRYRRTGLQMAFRALFGHGLFTRTGKSHIDHRRVIQPLFHRRRLDRYVPPIRQALAEVIPGWQDGQVVEVNGTLTTITLKAAGRMVFGLQRDDQCVELFEGIHASHQRIVRNMRSSVPLAGRMPTRRNGNIRRYIQRIDVLTKRLIAEARAGARGESLLAQLVQLRDSAGRGLDDRQIRDHVLTIFLAGYEPTATSLSWILYLLSRHPGVQEKLQAEIDANPPFNPSSDQTPELSSSESTEEAAEIYERPYMSQVISEALRLYPSTWILMRRALEPDSLPSGATIPRGAEICACPLLVHRDASRYDDADQFRPERFELGIAARRATGEYFPFGLGPAACLGEYLARTMMSATVEEIVSRFTLSKADDSEPRMYSLNQFTMQADRPIRIRLAARASAQSDESLLAAA
jgi:cytochrome P450/glycosyltransferase involved in cell wall biosynthesis